MHINKFHIKSFFYIVNIGNIMIQSNVGKIKPSPAIFPEKYIKYNSDFIIINYNKNHNKKKKL